MYSFLVFFTNLHWVAQLYIVSIPIVFFVAPFFELLATNRLSTFVYRKWLLYKLSWLRWLALPLLALWGVFLSATYILIRVFIPIRPIRKRAFYALFRTPKDKQV